VLSLRLAIFAGVFGIALWGLFSLLGNLREPKVLCQQFLLDKHSVPPRSAFKVTQDRKSGEQHVIGGTVNDQRFTCTVRDGKVVDARLSNGQP
jgi:hypothetical protein